MKLKVIQQVFDNSKVEFVDQHGKHLEPVVEQLSDGIFVGYYLDVKAEWVDAEKLGDTPEQALVKAREIVAG